MPSNHSRSSLRASHSPSTSALLLFLLQKRAGLPVSPELGIPGHSTDRHKPSYEDCMRQPGWRKRMLRAGKCQWHPSLHCMESHKNAKLNKQPRHVYRGSSTDSQNCVVLASLSVTLWALLSWFSGVCSPGVLDPSGCYNPSSLP